MRPFNMIYLYVSMFAVHINSYLCIVYCISFYTVVNYFLFLLRILFLNGRHLKLNFTLFKNLIIYFLFLYRFFFRVFPLAIFLSFFLSLFYTSLEKLRKFQTFKWRHSNFLITFVHWFTFICIHYFFLNDKSCTDELVKKVNTKCFFIKLISSFPINRKVFHFSLQVFFM